MKIFRKIGKWLLIIIGSIIGIILLLLLIIRINSSGVEEPFPDEHGKVLLNSIAMHEDMLINGAPQRITIRGKNKNNPVLLLVHGGPGNIAAPFAPKTAGYSLEDIFTVCYWEQRGAGLAYTKDLPDSTITLNQIVDDGIEVVNYLRKTLEKAKIYIEGTSWGTTVSAFMVQKKPELFHAYIGVGQMANQPLSEQMSYDFVMKEAQKQNDTPAIKELKRIGRPPYPQKSNIEMAEACDVERLLVMRYVPMRRTPSFKEFRKAFLDNGLTFKEKFTYLINNPEQYYPAYKILWPTCFNVNLIRDAPEWEIPVYIMHGDNDHFTETSLAREYFDSLKAPVKKWFLFEDATHSVQFEQPEKYRSIYINEILKK
ncbi:MAG: alpha/beta hydrolase [Ferruginibacter sp.]